MNCWPQRLAFCCLSTITRNCRQAYVEDHWSSSHLACHFYRSRLSEICQKAVWCAPVSSSDITDRYGVNNEIYERLRSRIHIIHISEKIFSCLHFQLANYNSEIQISRSICIIRKFLLTSRSSWVWCADQSCLMVWQLPQLQASHLVLPSPVNDFITCFKSFVFFQLPIKPYDHFQGNHSALAGHL